MKALVRMQAVSLVLLATAMASADSGQDVGNGWTQWGGPHRDFTVQTKLPDAWPEDGPKVVWSRELGDGFSTIVTDGDVLFATYRANEDQEGVIAISAADGSTIWEQRYDSGFTDEGEKRKHDLRFGKGPNSTPLLVDGRLYTIGFASKMHCYDAKTGKVLWKKDLLENMKGTFLPFGYSASPIAFEDTVIVLVGGVHQGVVAFDQKTGDIRWQNTDYDASYSSPILTEVDGTPHLVAYMSEQVMGMDPKNGDVSWTVPYKNQWSTAINTPVACGGDRLYFVNGGDAGARMVKLVKEKGQIIPKPVWQNSKVKSGLNNQILIDDYFYGGAGERKNIMMAFSAKDGEVAWQERGFEGVKGVAAGNKMILLDNKGVLMLADVSPKGVEVKSKKTVLEEPAWSAPTLVGNRVYLRDRKKIVALEM